jgi:hypothetical protein
MARLSQCAGSALFTTHLLILLSICQSIIAAEFQGKWANKTYDFVRIPLIANRPTQDLRP